MNKIDLVGYDEKTFRDIVIAYRKFAEPLGFRSLFAIPLSARYGDNVSAPERAHAVVSGRASDGLPRAHRGRGGPARGAVPPAGAVDQPPAPRLPRRRRHDRQRTDREGRPGRRRGLRPADRRSREILVADAERRQRRGRRRRHADARRRTRHRAGRRAVASRQPAGGRRPVHRQRDLDERRSDAARPLVPDEDRDADRSPPPSPSSSTGSTSTITTSSPPSASTSTRSASAISRPPCRSPTTPMPTTARPARSS